MSSNSQRFAILLALYALFTLSSCAGEVKEKGTNLGNNEKYGGVFTTNQFQDFSTLFPVSAYESSASQVGIHLYETLVGYTGRNHTLTPKLAESWEINENSTIFKFKVRKNVYFHDDECFETGKGRTLTPKDIEFCFRRLCSATPDNVNSWLLLGQVKGAQEYHDNYKVDPEAEISGIRSEGNDTFIIELEESNPEFIHVLAHYGTSIFPKEMEEYYGVDKNFNPIGTGPFKKELIRAGKVVILERNTNYWGRDKNGDPLPYLDGVKITFETDATPVTTALKEGTLHAVIDGDMQEGGDIFSKAVALNSAAYRTDGQLDFEVVYCGFLNEGSIFEDIRLRKAFNLAIDKSAISDVTLKGSAYPGVYGIVPPSFAEYPVANVNGLSYDLEKAKELLTEAGYPNGEGFPVVNLQIQNRYKDVIVAQSIQQQLMENLNVTISVSAVPRANHFSRIENKEVSFWLDGWTADFLDPQNFLSLFISQNTPEATGSYLNTYRYQNESFDDLTKKAIMTSDARQRMRYYAKADSLMISEAAILPLYYEKAMIVSKSNVQGLTPPIMRRLDLREVYMEH